MCLTICVSVSLTIRRCTATSIISRPLPQSRLLIALQSTMSSVTPASSPLPRKLPTTPTARICLSATPRIYSRLSISRMSSRLSTPQAPYSMPSSARSCLIGELPPTLSERSQITTSCPIILFRPLTPYAATTATSQAKNSSAPTAAPPPAVSPATIAPSKTGTTARLRNTKSAKSIISLTHTLRVTVITPLAPARSVKRPPALSPTDFISSRLRPAPIAK